MQISLNSFEKKIRKNYPLTNHLIASKHGTDELNCYCYVAILETV